MKKHCYPFSLLLLLLSCSIFSNELKFNTNSFQIAINPTGNISKLCDKKTGSNYLSKEIAAPMVSLRVDGKIIPPQSAILDKENQAIILTYENEIQAQIKVESKDTHLTFELISISLWKKSF